MLPVFAFLLLSFEVDLDEVLAGELVDELLEVGIRLDFEGFALFVGVLDGGFIDPLELSGDEVVELLVLEGSLVELVSVVVGDDCLHWLPCSLQRLCRPQLRFECLCRSQNRPLKLK